MKKLYIRFFQNKEDTIPSNSESLYTSDVNNGTTFSYSGAGDLLTTWMGLYPNGKVDFVWL